MWTDEVDAWDFHLIMVTLCMHCVVVMFPIDKKELL